MRDLSGGEQARVLIARTWTHITAVATDHEMVIYINGQEQARAPRNGRTQPSTRGVMTIGSYSSSGNVTFDGALDEVVLYSRALSPAEIERSHAVALSKSPR